MLSQSVLSFSLKALATSHGLLPTSYPPPKGRRSISLLKQNSIWFTNPSGLLNCEVVRAGSTAHGKYSTSDRNPRTLILIKKKRIKE